MTTGGASGIISTMKLCPYGTKERYAMTKVNQNFLKLPGSYLFSEIARRLAAYTAEHPEAKMIRLGIGCLLYTSPSPRDA